jgi:hypothetical protein
MKTVLVITFIVSTLSAGLGLGKDAKTAVKDAQTVKVSRIEAQLAQAR